MISFTYSVDPMYFIATLCLSGVEFGHAWDRQKGGRTDIQMGGNA